MEEMNGELDTVCHGLEHGKGSWPVFVRRFQNRKAFCEILYSEIHIDATVHSRVYVDVAFQNSYLSNENRGNNRDPGMM